MNRTLEELAADFEKASEIYARSSGIRLDLDWFVLKMQEELGELVQAHLRLTGRGRGKGEAREAMRLQLENEAADLLGQLLLFVHHQKIDIEAACERKWFRHLPVEQIGGLVVPRH